MDPIITVVPMREATAPRTNTVISSSGRAVPNVLIPCHVRFEVKCTPTRIYLRWPALLGSSSLGKWLILPGPAGTCLKETLSCLSRATGYLPELTMTLSSRIVPNTEPYNVPVQAIAIRSCFHLPDRRSQFHHLALATSSTTPHRDLELILLNLTRLEPSYMRVIELASALTCLSFEAIGLD